LKNYISGLEDFDGAGKIEDSATANIFTKNKRWLGFNNTFAKIFQGKLYHHILWLQF